MAKHFSEHWNCQIKHRRWIDDRAPLRRLHHGREVPFVGGGMCRQTCATRTQTKMHQPVHQSQGIPTTIVLMVFASMVFHCIKPCFTKEFNLLRIIVFSSWNPRASNDALLAGVVECFAGDVSEHYPSLTEHSPTTLLCEWLSSFNSVDFVAEHFCRCHDVGELVQLRFFTL